MRPDLGKLGPGEQELSELRLLLARRRDLITDRSRTVTRLREALLSLFPALERTLDLNSKGPLILLTHYQTPAKLRRAGQRRVAAYLRSRGVKGSANVARKALSAAGSQSVILPAQEVASRIVAQLAAEVLTLKERIESIDEEISQRFSPVPRLGFSIACRAWDRSSGPSSWSVWATFAPSRAPIIWPPTTRVLSRRPVTRASGWVTAAGCEEGTRPSKGSSTRQRLPVCVVHRSPESSTIAREWRAKGTSKP
jgi:hypothetical protein